MDGSSSGLQTNIEKSVTCFFSRLSITVLFCSVFLLLFDSSNLLKFGTVFGFCVVFSISSLWSAETEEHGPSNSKVMDLILK